MVSGKQDVTMVIPSQAKVAVLWVGLTFVASSAAAGIHCHKTKLSNQPRG